MTRLTTSPSPARAGHAPAETLFTQVLAHLPEGIWVCDVQSHTLHRNPAAIAIWDGVRDADVSRFPGCLGWWADTGRPIGDDEWGSTRALKAGEAVMDERVEIETTEGVRKVLLTSYIPLKGGDGACPGCLVLIKDITTLHRTEHRLSGAEASLLVLSQRPLQVQEAERQHIAQELHDDIGILAALRSLVASLGQLPALVVRLQAEGGALRYPPGVETAAFRIVQEALSNAMRHSACTAVDIRVALTPERLQLSITDDGVGFEPERAVVAALRNGHIGLAGIQERARLAGGSCELRSGAGQGTTVHAVFDTGALAP